MLARLRDDPDGPAVVNFVAALSSPLMIGLARVVYSDTSDRDPAVLLDARRFSTTGALEDHLLDAFVSAVYRHPLDRHTGAGQRGPRLRRYDPDCAQRWLGYLAHHLDRLGTRGLMWWGLGKSLPVYVGMLAGVMMPLLNLLMVSLGTLVAWTGLGYFADQFGALGSEFPAGVGAGLALGFFSAMPATAVALFTFADTGEFRPSRLRRCAGGRAQLSAIGMSSGLGLCTGGGLVVAFLHGPQAGLICGIVGGLVVAVLAQFETPSDIKTTVSPSALLAMDRKNTVVQLLVCWGLFELVFMLGLAAGAGRGYGFALGLLTGFVTWYFSGKSVRIRWLLFARIGLPLHRRQPWAVTAFLNDARQRGVLRQAGAVYQFRHARLQDHLARHYQTHHDQRPN